MTYQELRQYADLFSPALAVDSLVSPQIRHRMRGFLELLAIALLCAAVAALSYPPLAPYLRHIVGSFLLSVSFWLILALASALFDSFANLDIVPTIREKGLPGMALPLTYAVASMLDTSDPEDVTPGFVRHAYGATVLARLGIPADAVAEFLGARSGKTSGDTLSLVGSRIDALAYAHAVFNADAAFADFLFKRAIQEKDFLGACEWVQSAQDKEKRRRRWWSRENFGRIPSMGKELSYGRIYNLKKYSREITEGLVPREAGVAHEVEELETILVREKEANALIVADVGSGEMDVLYGLLGNIQSGMTPPQLEDKRIYQFDATLLIDAVGGDKAAFESEFNAIMQEAIDAGNIIIAFTDLPALIESAKHIGTDIVPLLYPFLTSAQVQVIAFADKGRFHESIEQNGMLMNTFEVLRLAEKDERLLAAILESEVLVLEARTRLFFTYQAVEAVAEAAIRFFTDGVPLDKAKDVLAELPTVMARKKKRVVERDDVMSMVAEKTGIPQEGKVDEGEKQKLLELEKLLHERIVGQNEAIVAIANAMRRARAGLRNPNKPIGSFLFLGPTGVGKTETAKTLAEVFFGKAAPMLRLDMSEYTGADALERLIGSFELGKTGSLASMLRDQKYGVLLLDEFEKATGEVHNLFLQVLDEGYFSDMRGRKVNARNVIIIATSNAGSEQIFQMVEQGKALEEEKPHIIDSLIEKRLFRPELINRFDGVILFHPLSREHISRIAELAAARMGEELAKQGFRLQITPELLAYLAKEGFDEKFGARSMNRVLQETVEKLLAQQIIEGGIKKGQTISFSTSKEGTLELQAH